jgi:CxxC motif-containing protein (DUF1111 family)
VFDNDGCLWCEKPTPIQAGFLLRRIAEQAEADPALRDRQPWKAVHAKDQAWLGDVFTKHYEGDDTTLKEMAAAQKPQGLNGRLNYVRDDIQKKTVLGRFGWKANQPSIRQQIVAAFLGDMGVTSSLYIQENCPPVQTLCLAMPPGNRPELLDYNWDQMEFWQAALAPPAARNLELPQVKRGEQLFQQAGCAACHVPELRTGDYPLLPIIANTTFRAFTDLLLHDMGEDLADGRPDFLAGPRDWRTPPLWGIGLSAQVNGSTHLLHDGRARNVLEAILWHGGEAKAAKDAFSKMPADQREALISFVNAL